MPICAKSGGLSDSLECTLHVQERGLAEQTWMVPWEITLGQSPCVTQTASSSLNPCVPFLQPFSCMIFSSLLSPLTPIRFLQLSSKILSILRPLLHSPPPTALLTINKAIINEFVDDSLPQNQQLAPSDTFTRANVSEIEYSIRKCMIIYLYGYRIKLGWNSFQCIARPVPLVSVLGWRSHQTCSQPAHPTRMRSMFGALEFVQDGVSGRCRKLLCAKWSEVNWIELNWIEFIFDNILPHLQVLQW